MVCHTKPEWAQLKAHFHSMEGGLDLQAAFRQDPQRLAHLSQQAPHVFADLSKNWMLPQTEVLLSALAQACEVHALRDAMLAGQTINNTESRAVMHWLLRTPRDGGLLRTHPVVQQWTPQMQQALQSVHDTLDAMLTLAEQVRANPQITDVVNIGIGGSHLGPEVVVQALEDWVDGDKHFHFVSNVDGHELGHVLRKVRPENTLFLIASKSFTTAETMLNARSAREWFLAHGGSPHPQDACSIDQHFVALTTNTEAAAEFGISRTLGFWDWVGGRFSLWSAIGLPIAIAIGAEQFRQMLQGAHAMDAHFFSAPDAQNLPMAGAAGCVEPQLLRFWQPLHCALQPRAAQAHGLSAAAGDGKQWQGRHPRWAQAASSYSTHCLGRARHQWPARIFSDAAPGARCHSRGIHCAA